MQKPEITSKFDTTNRALYIVCVIFFFSLATYFLLQFDVNDFKTISNLLIALGALFFGSWILYEVYCAPEIVAFSNRIEVKRLYGLVNETYQRKEVKSWVLKEKPSKYGHYHNFYIVFESSKRLKLCSYDYSNFYELHFCLNKNLPIDTELDRQLEIRENLKFSMLLVFLGLIFILFSLDSLKNKELMKEDLATVQGHLSRDIELKSGSKSKSLSLNLNEYSDFTFKVSGSQLNETYYEDLIKDLKKGDEIKLRIEKTDFEKKITKQIPLTLWDKIYHYDKIFIVTITAKNFKYLSLEDYNKSSENKYLGFGFFSILGLICFVIGIYMFKGRKLVTVKKVKNKNKKKHKIVEE